MENTNTAQREKYWVELTEIEKIERMRDIVKKMQEQNNNLQNQVYSLQGQLREHEHINGKIYMPITRGGDLCGVTGIGRINQDPRKSYF